MADSQPPITISTLVNIARGSDGSGSDGFEDDVSRLADFILAHVHRVLAERDPSSIEDVTQEVFEKVIIYTRVHPDRLLSIPPKNLPWYIGVMARRMAIDHLRRLDSRREDVTDTPPDPLDPSPTADIFTEARLFERAISALPPKKQTYLRMRFYDGLSDAEIAQETGTPIGTVKSNIRSSVVSLKDYAERNRRPSKGE